MSIVLFKQLLRLKELCFGHCFCLKYCYCRIALPHGFVVTFSSQTFQFNIKSLHIFQQDTLEVSITDAKYKIFEPDFMEKLEIFVFKHQGRNVMNATFVYTRPVRNVQVRFTLQFEKADGTSKNLVKLDIDGCKFLESAYENQNLAKYILKSLKTSKNFLQKCPIEAVIMRVNIASI